MGDFEKLLEAAKPFCEKIRTVAESDAEITLVTHIDADGITSGSILGLALARIGAKFCVRTVSDINSSLLRGLKEQNLDFVLLSDLGAGWSDQIRKTIGPNWLVVDHHQLPEQECVTDDSNQIFNAWKFGIDGSTQISAGGMAYVIAYGLDPRNRDLSPLSVVSAVADRQDQGEKRSLLGPNNEIAKLSESLGLVSEDLDLMLSGRETRPCHDALANTSFPYIEGLTWHPDACLNLLNSAGIKLRENGRWRVPTDLSQEEKSTLLGAVAKYINTTGKDSSVVVDNLVGFVFTLNSEDVKSQLRDAREFGILLNACGRIGSAGVGIAVCFGDRNTSLEEAERLSNSYKVTLRSLISVLNTEKWRIEDQTNNVLVNGDGIITGDMLGAMSSLLSGSPSLAGKIIIARTILTDGSDSLKFSCRKGVGSGSKSNLGLVMRHCAAAVGGTGGGHPAAAGCRIPASSLNEFLSLIRTAVGDPRFDCAT